MIRGIFPMGVNKNVDVNENHGSFPSGRAVRRNWPGRRRAVVRSRSPSSVEFVVTAPVSFETNALSGHRVLLQSGSCPTVSPSAWPEPVGPHQDEWLSSCIKAYRIGIKMSKAIREAAGLAGSDLIRAANGR